MEVPRGRGSKTNANHKKYLFPFAHYTKGPKASPWIREQSQNSLPWTALSQRWFCFVEYPFVNSLCQQPTTDEGSLWHSAKYLYVAYLYQQPTMSLFYFFILWVSLVSIEEPNILKREIFRHKVPQAYNRCPLSTLFLHPSFYGVQSPVCKRAGYPVWN